MKCNPPFRKESSLKKEFAVCIHQCKSPCRVNFIEGVIYVVKTNMAFESKYRYLYLDDMTYLDFVPDSFIKDNFLLGEDDIKDTMIEVDKLFDNIFFKKWD